MTGKNGAIVSPKRNCAHFSRGKNSEGRSPPRFSERKQDVGRAQLEDGRGKLIK